MDSISSNVVVEDYDQSDEISSIEDMTQLPKRGKHIKKWKDSAAENNEPSSPNNQYMESSLGGRMKNSLSHYEKSKGCLKSNKMLQSQPKSLKNIQNKEPSLKSIKICEAGNNIFEYVTEEKVKNKAEGEKTSKKKNSKSSGKQVGKQNEQKKMIDTMMLGGIDKKISPDGQCQII